MAVSQSLIDVTKAFVFLLVLFGAGLLSLVTVKANYSFGATFYITGCQNCEYGECLKLNDPGYVCGGSNDRSDNLWQSNCKLEIVLDRYTGGSCPIGHTCRQYGTFAACGNNNCILVLDPVPTSTPIPTPTIYPCGVKRTPPNSCSVDTSTSPATTIGCAPGYWCKQYTDGDKECRLTCSSTTSNPAYSVCKCVSNNPIGVITTDPANCTFSGWSGDMANPELSNTIQYQIYKVGTTPGALSSPVTANSASGEAVCMALYGNDTNYSAHCAQCKTNPNLPQCRHGYGPVSVPKDGNEYEIKAYGNKNPGTPVNKQVTVELTGSPKRIRCVTPTPTPTCTTPLELTISDSCNKVSVTANSLPPAISFTSIADIPGKIEACNKISLNSFKCDLKTSEQFPAILSYKDSGIDCSKTVNIRGAIITPPACASTDYLLTTDPSEIYYNDSNIKLQASAGSNDPNYNFTLNSISVSGLTNLQPPLGTIPAPTTATGLTVYTWTADSTTSTNQSFSVNYNKTLKSCGNIYSACDTESKNMLPQLPNSYMLTTGGSLHAYNADQKGFHLTKSLASKVLTADDPADHFKLGKYLCSVQQSLCSTRVFAFSYPDKNSDTSFYSNLLSSVKSKLSFSLEPMITEPIWDNLNNNPVIEITTDLHVPSGATCSRKTAFFIAGDLTIAPDFTLDLSNKKDNACLFVVKGKTTISAGDDGNPDKVDAFIITNGFETSDDSANHDQLMINGGVITSGNISFLRNLNYITGNTVTTSNEPSEIINYEGARYIRLFNDIFSPSTQINIRENQYVK